MFTGSFGFEHFLTQRASWKGQITAGSHAYPTFHEDLTVINRTPVGVGFGLSYRISRRGSLHLSTAENIFSAWADLSWSASLKAEF